jgi:LVIVD repeat
MANGRAAGLHDNSLGAALAMWPRFDGGGVMRTFVRLSVPAILVVSLLVAALPAGADHIPADHRRMDLLFESPNEGNFTNSDLAFWGDLAFAGNYGGFRIFDISDPADPALVSDITCFGPQNDVSVWDRDRDGAADILFLSVDTPLTGPECGATAAADRRDPGAWEGIRIFDVSDPAQPFQIGDVYQDCGSHTHTLVPRRARERRVLLYNSSYPLLPGPTCGQPADGQPPHHDRDPLHGVIQVVEVSWSADDPLDSDDVEATEIAEPRINYPGDPDNTFVPDEHGLVGLDPLRACHDIGVHVGVGLAAGACAEQVQLWKVGRDGIPRTTDPVWVFDDPVDRNGATGDPGDREVAVDFWHTARFTWDGKYVQGDDESFGDGCPPVSTIGLGVTEPNSDTGRTHLLRTSTGQRMSTFMIPRPEEDAYCSMHQGNFIPTPGRYLSVNAWYNGGVDIIDFTAVRRPREIAFFDHEAVGETPGSNNWAHYWYEADPRRGRPVTTYGQDITRGFQVFSADVAVGRRFGVDHLNPQTQESLLK